MGIIQNYNLKKNFENLFVILLMPFIEFPKISN